MSDETPKPFVQAIEDALIERLQKAVEAMDNPPTVTTDPTLAANDQGRGPGHIIVFAAEIEMDGFYACTTTHDVMIVAGPPVPSTAAAPRLYEIINALVEAHIPVGVLTPTIFTLENSPVRLPAYHTTITDEHGLTVVES